MRVKVGEPSVQLIYLEAHGIVACQPKLGHPWPNFGNLKARSLSVNAIQALIYRAISDKAVAQCYFCTRYISRFFALLLMFRLITRTFAALRYRNYRLWFLGQLASLVGTFMQASVQGYFAYELTRSSWFLGLLGFVAGLPTCILLLYGGVVADRRSRRKVFMLSQFFAMLLASTLAILTFTGTVTQWHLLAIAFLLGITSAFEIPARHALVAKLVPAHVLPNSIGLNASMFQLAFTIGPTIGGLIYKAHGPGWCFAINAFSYVAVIVTMFMIVEDHDNSLRESESTVKEISAGLLLVAKEPLLRTLFCAIGIASLFGSVHWTLLPAWAVEYLHGDAETNGYLNTARGLGALSAALQLAYLGRGPKRKTLLLWGATLLPIMLLALAAVSSLTLAMIVLSILGWAYLVLINTALAMVQEHVSDNMRGRVMSVNSLALFGMAPICALWAGSLAPIVGIPLVFALSSALTFCALLLVYCLSGKKSLDAGSPLFQTIAHDSASPDHKAQGR